MVTKLLASLDSAGVESEVVIVENGSSDGSDRIVDGLALGDPRVHAMHLTVANYGAALRHGFMSSSSEYVANFSVDWVDLNFLQSAMSKLDECDIVLASKGIQGSSDQRPWVLRMGSLWFHRLVRILFRLPVSDTHGIKVFRRDTVVPIMEKCRLGGDNFDTELVLRAHRAGLSICELPVHIEEIRPSRGRVLTRAIKALSDMLKLRVALWLERPR